MKSKGLIIFLIILLSLISVLLIVLMLLGIKGGFNFSFKGFLGHDSINLYIDKKYDISFKSIYLNTETAKISIKKGNEFRIIVYSDNDVKVDASSDSLNIKEKKIKRSWFNNSISKVEVYVPEDYSDKIQIENNYGKIFIDEFKNSSVSININYGDIDIVEAKNITVDSDLGNVIIGRAKSIDVEQSKGNAEIGEVHDAVITNNLGNITIDKVTNYVNIEENCGNVHIKDAVINKNSSIQNDLGNISVDKLNEVFVDAKNSLGNTNVKNHYNSDITLTINNDCGNITVNN